MVRGKRRVKFAEILSSRKITAYKLAKTLGYKDVTTVYRWIYVRGEPNAATMLKLMEILDVSALDLLQAFAEGNELI
jgi:transcriptional regulator with XRE-family HTH domain